MKYLLVILLIFFTSVNIGIAAVQCLNVGRSSCAEIFQYGDPIGARYRTLTILDDTKVVRVLRGEVDNGGVFEQTEVPVLSPDGNFALINQIESGEVEASSGSITHHEVAYCDLLDVRSGCIIAKETGEFCGGTFSSDGKWNNQLYPEFNLAAETPKAKNYVGGLQQFSDSPASSFDNLLFCDPPNINNVSDYRILIERNNFNLKSLDSSILKKMNKNKVLINILRNSS
ncbi:hypothetical protein [Pseudomonas sp. DP16D-R1]|uniref:hypothetical protein n=1 Tax=Pseudomonas sp. DP16D-R1 TaxID=2075551 RepID=UPI0011AF85AF|nr:hypothetical protein [Pseudomonas sp. DP16D-R1]